MIIFMVFVLYLPTHNDDQSEEGNGKDGTNV